MVLRRKDPGGHHIISEFVWWVAFSQVAPIWMKRVPRLQTLQTLHRYNGTQEDADVEPFMVNVPANHVLTIVAPTMGKASLKRITKFAYKLPEGFKTCTFKGLYASKKARHQGTYVMHFKFFTGQCMSMYLDLKNNPHGLQESWVTLKRVWFSHVGTCLFANSRPLCFF